MEYKPTMVIIVVFSRHLAQAVIFNLQDHLHKLKRSTSRRMYAFWEPPQQRVQASQRRA